MKKGKLDKRHSGYGDFQFYIDLTRNECTQFYEIRNWCWETWGPSCELELVKKVGNNGNWSWIFDEWRRRILFKSDKEYNWFYLKWGDLLKR